MDNYQFSTINYQLIMFFVLTVNLSVAKAQTKDDFLVASAVFDQKEQTQQYKFSDFKGKNELQSAAYGLFIFYKKFISSQDLNSCVFYPSCSVYTITSIKKHGFFFGFLDGFDRLQRCNRVAHEKYKKYKNSNLLYDPVD